jgi:iron(III) transport system permease protein
MIGARRSGDTLLVGGVLLAMAAFLAAPLGVLGIQAFGLDAGGFTLAVVHRYLATPGLARSLANTALLAGGVVAVVLPSAFAAAFALERSRLPGKAVLQAIFSAPLLIPSLLPALALVYLFGHQGLLTPWFGGRTIYGAQGVLVADAIAAFPHALIILRTALAAADGRLYEQADLLGAGRWRSFWRITLPNVRHGLVSAAVVVFSLTIADVGAPKVVGGNFDVLALDIYKAVLGRQDFQRGRGGDRAAGGAAAGGADLFAGDPVPARPRPGPRRGAGRGLRPDRPGDRGGVRGLPVGGAGQALAL